MQEQNLPTPVTTESPTQKSVESSEAVSTDEALNAPIATPEKKASAAEHVNQSAPAQQPIAPVNLPQPVPDPSVTVSDPDDVAIDDNSPPVADDVDVIEKAWVQKAKSIVAKTKSDPYQQEKKVSELQTDYQTKRFGDVITGE